ncbi:hypothetical protein Sinac_5002 [Singulisphaera acidiphila DSM 18658]|uniref:Uncharacterized protein n=1 Tax=Singulisphaera acidiphila (strain ATCC BAA-1392 / DSM 18658 / VKM B-2454 / MOB10) TaxID=886293 RepID=L0DIS3_SINAD|nr:hypothetical protein Sinac_5002 [Singulisphaera acidiphila DSM 18658]
MGIGLTVEPPPATIEAVRFALDKGGYTEASRLVKLLEATPVS